MSGHFMSDEIQRTLGRIESSIESLKDLVKAGNDDHDALERRVSKVEARQHWYSGAGAVLGALAGIFLGKPH